MTLLDGFSILIINNTIILVGLTTIFYFYNKIKKKEKEKEKYEKEKKEGANPYC
jgi:preprotein translocase subunit YajC